MKQFTKEEFIEIYNSNDLLKDVIKELKCSHVTVIKYAKMFNLPSKRKTVFKRG